MSNAHRTTEAINRDSELRKLPVHSALALANILEEMKAWKTLMANIKREDNPNYPKYNLTQIKYANFLLY
jgi:hypothetical protein